jgi:hypothetical protein
LLCGTPAAGYELASDSKPRWPFDRITYYVGQVVGVNPDGTNRIEPATRAQTRAVMRAMRSWSRSGVGWRLERVFTSAPTEADVLFELNPRSRFPRCQGLATQGFGFTQARVALRGSCGEGRLLSLIAAHELGHVLGLGDEPDTCAAMNQGYVRTRARVQPAECTDGNTGTRAIVRLDDRRGAHRLYRRWFSGLRRLCDPSGETPVFATNAPCRYSFDCRGVAGDHLIDETHDGVTDTRATEDLIIDDCRRRLRVRSLSPTGAEPHPSLMQPAGSVGRYTGLTSAATRVSFRVRGGFIRGLRLEAVYKCSDGTTPFSRPDPLRLLPDNHEVIGPFPPIRLGRRGFRTAFETPNETALYELEGRFTGRAWTGGFRALEGWGEVDERTVGPNPDGLFLCDTGRISFTARQAG